VQLRLDLDHPLSERRPHLPSVTLDHTVHHHKATSEALVHADNGHLQREEGSMRMGGLPDATSCKQNQTAAGCAIVPVAMHVLVEFLWVLGWCCGLIGRVVVTVPALLPQDEGLLFAIFILELSDPHFSPAFPVAVHVLVECLCVLGSGWGRGRRSGGCACW
jgi:hypothetical protein